MIRSDPQRTPRTLRLLSDDRLSAWARRGDRDAFAELYRRYHQRIYRYSLSLLRQPEDAADALQATMAKALTALEDEELVERVRPWLFRIAHNEAISLLRLRRPHVELGELAQTEVPTSPDAPSEAAGREELAQLVADVHGLPARQQSALVMRELSGLSYDEIAGALETSALASRQLVHQARSALHDQAKGRAMECETVREAVGEANGRAPRNRRFKAHLVGCGDCRGFQHALRARGTGLSAFAPPLASAAASDILRRLLETGSSPAGAVAAGGGVAVGVATVAGGGSTGKLAAVAATAAVIAGGASGAAVVGVDGRADRPERSSQDAERGLDPGVRRFRPFGEIARGRQSERRTERTPVRKRRLSVATPGEDTGVVVPVTARNAPAVEEEAARGGDGPPASTRGAIPKTRDPGERRESGRRRSESDERALPSELSVDPFVLGLPSDAPKFEVPTVGVPTVDTPPLETPDTEVPSVDVPVDPPPVDVPGVPPVGVPKVPPVPVPSTGSAPSSG